MLPPLAVRLLDKRTTKRRIEDILQMTLSLFH